MSAGLFAPVHWVSGLNMRVSDAITYCNVLVRRLQVVDLLVGEVVPGLGESEGVRSPCSNVVPEGFPEVAIV